MSEITSNIVLLASHNANKLREVREILEPKGYVVNGPDDVGGLPDVEETGTTFEDNALLKARAAAHASGLPALADDSGLEVDALDGAPGVHSARYAGDGASDTDKINKLLTALAATGDTDRKARFVCVLAYALPEGNADSIRDTCEGRILEAPAGDGGFGYDPVFAPDGSESSFAQLTPEQKNAISHRGNALRRLGDLLKRFES